DGDPRGYELLRLSAPGRLVLDVSGVKLATTVRKPGSGLFATLRSGAHPDKVRLVVDAASSVDGRVTFTTKGLRWTLGPSAPAAVASAAPAAAPKGKNELKDGEVEIDGRVVTSASAAAATSTPAPGPQAELLDLGF